MDMYIFIMNFDYLHKRTHTYYIYIYMDGYMYDKTIKI